MMTNHDFKENTMAMNLNEAIEFLTGRLATETDHAAELAEQLRLENEEENRTGIIAAHSTTARQLRRAIDTTHHLRETINRLKN